MSTLNILCSICSEFYRESDTVYSTTVCGHLFHKSCLISWLRRSQTCPQCRTDCPPLRMHKVHLNFALPTEDADMPDLYTGPVWNLLDSSIKNIPADAVKMGCDPDGRDTYVARVYFREDLLPAAYVPSLRGAYAPYGCSGHFLAGSNDIELLTYADVEWIPAAEGRVPDNAIITGYSETGENLYTGCGTYEGIQMLGKIHPSHGVMYIAYNGVEVNVKEYNVLVTVPKKPKEKEEGSGDGASQCSQAATCD